MLQRGAEVVCDCTDTVPAFRDFSPYFPLFLSVSRRNCDSDCSDGEEDFYYTEIKLNTDSVADGLSSLSPVSPSVLSPPPLPPLFLEQ